MNKKQLFIAVPSSFYTMKKRNLVVSGSITSPMFPVITLTTILVAMQVILIRRAAAQGVLYASSSRAASDNNGSCAILSTVK